MSLPEDVRRAQQELSRVALDLAETADRDAASCGPWPWVAGAEGSGWFDEEPYLMQRWPTFVDGPKMATVRRATEGIVALAKDIPERVFDGDPERIAEFYGLEDEVFAMLWLEPPNGLAGAIGRCDFIDGPGGFRCLELNMAGNLGGWETHYTVPWLLRNPFVAAALERAGASPSYVSPIESFFSHVAQDAVAQGLTTGGRVDLGFLVYQDCWLPPAGQAELDALYRQQVEGLDYGLTGSLVLGRSAAELEEGDEGELLIAGRRVHALVEYNGDMDTPRAAFRAFKAELLALYNGPVTRLLVDKRNLALLSELADSDRVSAEERAVLEDHVPWGRVVAERRTRFHGETEDLVPLILARRGDFVLKRATGLGGVAVIIGRATGAEEWQRAVRGAAADGQWLVQEYQESWPYAFQGAGGGWAPHDAVWGTYCFGARYGGGVMRLGPRQAAGVLNSELGATVCPILEV